MTVIRRFRPDDQAAARALILAGLAEHWGPLDPARNRDLDDLRQAFADGEFWVADDQGQIVGTAGLLLRGPETGEIVRVSIARERRRAGLGRALLASLVTAAEARGLRSLTVETTASWSDAVAFYDRLGFRRTHLADGDQHFELGLSRRPVWET